MVIPKRIFLFLALLLLALASFSVLSHEEQAGAGEGAAFEDQGQLLQHYSLWVIIIAGIIVIILILIAVLFKEHQTNGTKKVLFVGMVIPIIMATFYSAGTTIYLNTRSETGGPVHWHADFEMWKCGQQIYLMDPEGFSNRVGTPILHEHDDNRIHVEGVVVTQKSIALHHFFKVAGGSLTSSSFSIPTNEGPVSVREGELCGTQPGKVQLFLFKIINPSQRGSWVYQQQKVSNPEEYVLSPYSNIPPGDCLILEFDADKEHTDKLCASYKAAIERGELYGR